MEYRPKYTITDKLRRNLREIDRLKDKIRGARIMPETEAAIRLRATVEATHSSTSIEGNPLSIDEVRTVLTKPALTKQRYAEIEVLNYGRVLDFINQQREQQEIGLADILELHRIITENLLDKTRNGKIRRNPVYIESPKYGVVYTGPEPKKVKQELEKMIAWLAEQQFMLHPVIVAAVLHYQLVAIHPFADGNGRTARALAALYLAMNHYDCNGALVLDSYYAEDRRAYYDILQSVGGESYAMRKKADLTPWLEYFTDGFIASLHVLDAEIKIINTLFLGSRANGLSREEQDIISYVTEFGSVNIAEAEEMMPGLSKRSVQRRLKRLVSEGYLRTVGQTHELRYVLAKLV